MRTRLSPRNQRRLCRQLSGAPVDPAAPASIADRIAFEQRVLDTPGMSRSSRALAERTILRLRRMLPASERTTEARP